MLKIIVIVVVVAVVAVVAILALAATKPDTFRVQRTTSIQAPPEEISALINDFQRWREWSPYEQLDPAMKRTLSGAASGPGAVYAWESQGRAGVGRMEIMEPSTPSSIKLALDFTKPFATHNIVEYTLVPQGGVTRVTWTMNGPSPYIAKLIGVFVSMDRMIGKDFETGLANLKGIAEKRMTSMAVANRAP